MTDDLFYVYTTLFYGRHGVFESVIDTSAPFLYENRKTFLKKRSEREDFMSETIKDDQWIWTIIQDPEKNPQYLGQHDEQKDVSYIPIFKEKDHALRCMNLFKKDQSLKYEPQAVFYGELARDARENGFLVVLLDEECNILEWLQP